MNNIGVFQSESGTYYMYDGITNVILPIDIKLAHVIQNNEELDRELLMKNASADISNMMNKWNIASKNDELVIDESFVKRQIIEYPYPQLILGITENCNLRCKYCIFSGNYDDMRTHSKSRMTEEIALASVDYYMKCMREWWEFAPEKKSVISFYGGEALLELPLIQKVVDYVNAQNFDTAFAMTTNATLLNDDNIKYLVDHDFMMSVSFDGSEELHDKNRVFPNGEGSYHIVYENIKKLKDEIRKQGKEEKLPVMILTCYDSETDMEVLNDFFVNQATDLYTLGGRVSEVIPVNGVTKVNTSIQKLYQKYVDFLTSGEGSKDTYFLERIFGTGLKSIYSRSVALDGEKYCSTLANACIPGGKFFVDIHGNFHMCERINYEFSIGNYKEGFDYKKITELVQRWKKEVADYCGACPYKAICGICYAGCTSEDQFTIDKICKRKRPKALERQLGLLFSILEVRPEAFRFFTSNKDLVNEKYEKFWSVIENC